MKTFEINDEYDIACERENTSSGFRHLATLMHKGRIVETAKCRYQNRTWERYEYESVMEKLLKKTSSISDEEKEEFFARNRGESLERVNKSLGILGAVCAMGEVLNDGDLEAQNDWKKRMVSASVGDGLSFPDDWDSLSEDEKKRRLDKVASLRI